MKKIILFALSVIVFSHFANACVYSSIEEGKEKATPTPTQQPPTDNTSKPPYTHL